MTITLKQLLAGISGIEVKGKDQIPIQSLATDSRRVVPGSLFFALPGLRTDGHFFIDEAVDRGASAVICEKDGWVPPHITLVQADNLHEVVARVAARFYHFPAEKLHLTGFLGTSGKTVAATLLRHFDREARSTGLLGTNQYAVGGRTLPAHQTTPEPIELHGLLSQMQQQGCERVYMEVSSHGIDQGRVDGLQFQTLALLNLTPEHLNYHGSLENYVALEQAFLEQQAEHLQHFVAGIDDPQVRSVVASASQILRDKCLTFGTSADADIRAEKVSASVKDTRFTLVWPHGTLKLVSPLVGAFNLQNTLAAIACGYASGLDPVEMGARLLEFEGVRGRMEPVGRGQPFSILIDYMHTEAAYAKGLSMLRELGQGRLITIFGCGGNRNAANRPRITRIVAEKSDLAIATADNPRNETVHSIFADMREGNMNLHNLEFMDDRREAISRALSLANPGDIVLIAGKGHETFQEFGDCVVPFDDRAVAREILREQRKPAQ